MTSAIADEWLGTGLRFPIRPDVGRIGFVSGLALVRQSIETILDTEPGERIMLPDFGCGLRALLNGTEFTKHPYVDAGGHHRRHRALGIPYPADERRGDAW
jgi:hypothetical protein